MLKVLLIVAVISFVVWSLVRLVGKRTLGGTSRPRVIGPDDDPDFLRGLNRPRKPEDD